MSGVNEVSNNNSNGDKADEDKYGGEGFVGDAMTLIKLLT